MGELFGIVIVVAVLFGVSLTTFPTLVAPASQSARELGDATPHL